MQKGQFVRLLLSTTANPTIVVAAAKDMSLHLGASTEESTTKDTTGNAVEYEITTQTYDISGSGLVLTDADDLNTGAMTLDEWLDAVSDTTYYWRIATMKGDNQRTVDAVICSGTCKITSLQVQMPDRQNSTYNYTLNGYGAITIPS